MVQFGVSLLHTFVRKGRVSKSEQEHLEMMDPMIALLTLSAKKARNDEILLASLRCITAVVTLATSQYFEICKHNHFDCVQSLGSVRISYC